MEKRHSVLVSVYVPERVSQRIGELAESSGISKSHLAASMLSWVLRNPEAVRAVVGEAAPLLTFLGQGGLEEARLLSRALAGEWPEFRRRVSETALAYGRRAPRAIFRPVPESVAGAVLAEFIEEIRSHLPVPFSEEEVRRQAATPWQAAVVWHAVATLTTSDRIHVARLVPEPVGFHVDFSRQAIVPGVEE